MKELTEKEILEIRAKKVAEPIVIEKTDDNVLEVIEFLLGNERYALEVNLVQETYPLEDFSKLPCTPSFILGIMNLRGQILTIIDLKKLLQLPDLSVSYPKKIIILSIGDIDAGIVVDEIFGLKWINPTELQQNLPTLSGARIEYLLGITSEQMIVLDARKILSSKVFK